MVVYFNENALREGMSLEHSAPVALQDTLSFEKEHQTSTLQISRPFFLFLFSVVHTFRLSFREYLTLHFSYKFDVRQ